MLSSKLSPNRKSQRNVVYQKQKKKKTQQKLDYTIQGDARAENPTSADKSPFSDPNGDFDPFDEALISISIVPL